MIFKRLVAWISFARPSSSTPSRLRLFFETHNLLSKSCECRFDMTTQALSEEVVHETRPLLKLGANLSVLHWEAMMERNRRTRWTFRFGRGCVGISCRLFVYRLQAQEARPIAPRNIPQFQFSDGCGRRTVWRKLLDNHQNFDAEIQAIALTPGLPVTRIDLQECGEGSAFHDRMNRRSAPLSCRERRPSVCCGYRQPCP